MKNCHICGIDGVIVPDLPYEEREEIIQITEFYEIDFITLVSPTSKERIATIVKEAKGFIYLVSSLGVTGTRSNITTNLEEIILDIREQSDSKVAVGFGISTPNQAEEISKIADGIIVGSAIVTIIEKYKDKAEKPLYEYIKSMKERI